MGGAILKMVVSLVMMTAIALGVLWYKGNSAAQTAVAAGIVEGAAAAGVPAGHADVAASAAGDPFAGFTQTVSRGAKVLKVELTVVHRDRAGNILPRYTLLPRQGGRLEQVTASTLAAETAAPEIGPEPQG